jgi:hypothetical protein
VDLALSDADLGFPHVNLLFPHVDLVWAAAVSVCGGVVDPVAVAAMEVHGGYCIKVADARVILLLHATVTASGVPFCCLRRVAGLLRLHYKVFPLLQQIP